MKSKVESSLKVSGTFQIERTAAATSTTESLLSQQVIDSLEKFVCCLYGEKHIESVNEARKRIFWKNFERDEKVTDLSLLPPCKSSLEKHILRANYVARISRQARKPIVEIEEPQNHGWNEDCSVDWVSEPYPENVAELLIDRQDSANDNEISDFENLDGTDYSDNEL